VRGWLAAALAVGLVAQDIFFEPEVASEAAYWAWRIVPCALVLAALWWLARGSGGFRVGWRPQQGWGYWLRLSAAVLAIFTVGYLGFMLAIGGAGEARMPDARFVLQTGVYYPLVEEAIYRVALLTPLAPRIGKIATIAVGAVAFAALHVIRYDNPSPPNQLGGLFLCWAYLHSRSIAVPLAWHAAGNVILAYANVFAARMF
jgi:membrane protease YdiL (CAAX protease family)